MAIALPVEGLMAIGENGEDLSKVCHRYWGDNFCTNPISNDDAGISYAGSLRSMTTKILSEIVEEIKEERGEADIPLDEAQYDA